MYTKYSGSFIVKTTSSCKVTASLKTIVLVVELKEDTVAGKVVKATSFKPTPLTVSPAFIPPIILSTTIVDEAVTAPFTIQVADDSNIC